MSQWLETLLDLTEMEDAAFLFGPWSRKRVKGMVWRVGGGGEAGGYSEVSVGL